MTARFATIFLITSTTCVCAAAQDSVGSLKTALELEERSLEASTAGRAQEAEAFAARALRIREAQLGVGHSATTPALAALGVAYGAAGKLAEAVWAMQQVVELRTRALGDEHPALAADLYYLGQFQLALGRLDEAADALCRARRLVDASREAKHHDRAIVLGALAVVRVEQRRGAEAERLLQEALLALDGAADPTPPLAVVLAHDRLAYAAWKDGEPARAEALYRRVARLSEELYGVQHPEHAVALVNLGTVLQQANLGGAAEHLFRRALGILDGTVAANDPRLALALDRLARACADAGRQREAKGLQKRLARALGTRLPLDELPPPPPLLEGESLTPRALAAREHDRP
jgi:tetratricopeptide (TPR) repeat protein